VQAATLAYLTAKWPSPQPGPPCTTLPNCTLSQALQASTQHLQAFAGAMQGKGFPPGQYELAHAVLGLDSVGAWQARCAGLAAGTLAPLANRVSEVAADALVGRVAECCGCGGVGVGVAV
jgi:hypothetical protein